MPKQHQAIRFMLFHVTVQQLKLSGEVRNWNGLTLAVGVKVQVGTVNGIFLEHYVKFLLVASPHHCRNSDFPLASPTWSPVPFRYA